MSDSLVNMQVDPKAVHAVLEKQIQAAIIANLGSEDDLIAKAVTMALRAKVDKDGVCQRNRYYNTYDFLEAITGKAIREAAKESLHEYLKENTDKVRAAVLKEIKKPSRINSLARAFADAVEKSVMSSWSTNVTVVFDTGEK